MVVGDQDGIVQLFSMKKEELIVHFKTLPAEKVQSIQLGGAPGDLLITITHYLYYFDCAEDSHLF